MSYFRSLLFFLCRGWCVRTLCVFLLVLMGGQTHAAEVKDWNQSLTQSMSVFNRSSAGVLSLSLKQHTHTQPSRSLTPLLNQAKKHWDDLNTDTRDLVSPWLARPTDATVSFESAWRYDTNLPVVNHDTTHFRVHFVESGDNASTPEFAQLVGDVLEETYAKQHTDLGYLAVPNDLAAGNNGGDARFDVYLTELRGNGLFGYVVSEGSSGDPQRPWGAYSYMVLDNNYLNYGYTDPADPLKVTVAHEYYHAVQNGYSWQEDNAFMEQSATWMEDVVYPLIHDNYSYIGEPYADENGDGQYTDDLNADGVSNDGEVVLVDHNGNGRRDDGSQDWPELALDAFDDVPVIQYGRFLWVRYLSEQFDNVLVKSIWELAGSSNQGTYQSIDEALQGRGSSLAIAYQEYSTWAYDKALYQDGQNYPLVWVDRTVAGQKLSIASDNSPSIGNLGSSGYQPQVHLSTIYTQILEPAGLYQLSSTGGAPALTMLIDTGSTTLTHEIVPLENGVGVWEAPAGAVKVTAVISNTSRAKDAMSWTLVSVTEADLAAKSNKSSGGSGGIASFASMTGWFDYAFMFSLITLVTIRLRRQQLC